MPIKACQGCLKDQFLTTTEAVDCFTGKRLWMWGKNRYSGGAPYDGGALGTNDVISRSSPVQTISGGTNWKLICVSGGFQGAAGIKQDGTLWLWGYNYNGCLGNNNTIQTSSPVQTISAGTNWKQVSTSLGPVAAIKTDGSLWLWGKNRYSGGALGDNTRIDRSSPVQTFSAGTDWKQVSVGGGTAAIKTDGSLWLWGYGGIGQLGNNSLIARSSPVQTLSAGTDWKQVSMGGYSVAAIKIDGTLWTWGNNASGNLGAGTTLNRSTPAQTAAGGTNWKLISNSATSAVKTDGTVWLWGPNFNGQLGDNTRINRSIPVQTVSGGTNWKSISTGAFHSSGIKTDGTLWIWGCGRNGALGTNDVITRSSPVQTVSRGTNWKSSSVGAYITGAINEIEF